VDEFPQDLSESMTAAAILIRWFLGETIDDSPLMRKGAELCLGLVPSASRGPGSFDLYYWHYATVAFRRIGSRPWPVWRRAVAATLLSMQVTEGTWCKSRGSFAPFDPWGAEGGRVYSTALAVISLAQCATLEQRPPPK
jgi:hypothetical protein